MKTHALSLGAVDPAGYRRIVTASFVLHVGLVLVFVFAQGWTRAHPPRKPIIVTLTGGQGPRSTGLENVSARPVEQVAPPPKRPEPIRPAGRKPEEFSAMVKTPAKPDSKAPVAPVQQAPTTGREIQQGTSKAETGARGQGTGLSFGGGAGLATVDVDVGFCCYPYVNTVLAIIDSHWSRNIGQRGETTLKFTIQRDGTIADDIGIDKSGGPMLDRQSRAALESVRRLLPPLPQEYLNKSQTLTIHLTFPYVQ